MKNNNQQSPLSALGQAIANAALAAKNMVVPKAYAPASEYPLTNKYPEQRITDGMKWQMNFENQIRQQNKQPAVLGTWATPTPTRTPTATPTPWSSPWVKVPMPSPTVKPKTTPTPTPTPMPTRLPVVGMPAYSSDIGRVGSFKFDPYQKVPAGTDSASMYVRGFTPGQPSNIVPNYSALKYPGFLEKLTSADKQRQGLANLLMFQGFRESTLGNKVNNNNLFGAKPGGTVATFATPMQSIDYQLSSAVLGGGGNPNMNILNTNRPLTLGDIQQLYKSYDPPGAYLEDMLRYLAGNKGR